MTDGMSSRTGLILGEEGVERLRSASVVLAGCGAVGGYVLEGLVRAGVGRIKVVDADTFSESNLNRQILATVDTVGRPKADVAAERARSINPDVEIEAVKAMVSSETADIILGGGYGILVDAIDTVEHKVALLRRASELGMPTFSSMGAALRTDTSRIKVAPLAKTSVCPLAASVRKRLRGCDTGNIVCVYSDEPPAASPTDRDEHGKSVLGSLPTIPAIFGMTLANLAIMLICEKGHEGPSTGR